MQSFHVLSAVLSLALTLAASAGAQSVHGSAMLQCGRITDTIAGS